MSKDNSKKAVKNTAKKPVETKKTTKKTYEAKVEPKRTKAVEEKMSNEMVDLKKDDKIWIVIAALLILLIGGAFVANKVINTKETVETKIYTSKSISENNDGSVTVKVKIKSNVGLKSITLEDGTVMNYNNKKEVEVKFTAKENKEYKLVIKDENGKKTTKKIKITSIKEVEEEEEEQVLEVEQPKEQKVVYYYRPTPSVPKEEPKEEVKPALPVISGIENLAFTNKDVTLSVSASEIKNVALYVDGKQDEKFKLGDTLVEEGQYKLVVEDVYAQISTVEFEIDKTAPVFVGQLSADFRTVRDVALYAEDKNEVTFEVNNGTETTEKITDDIISEKGNYSIIAKDKAGNKTEAVNVEIVDLFKEALNNNIFTSAFTIQFNDGLDTTNYSIKLEKYTFDEVNGESYVEVTGFNISNQITEAGVYKLSVDIKDGKDAIIAEFALDLENPEVIITNESDNVTVEVSDDTSIKEAYYGYSQDKTKEPTEEEYKPLEENVPMELPTEDGDYYLWVTATDIANKETTVVSDEAITINNTPVATEPVPAETVENIQEEVITVTEDAQN